MTKKLSGREKRAQAKFTRKVKEGFMRKLAEDPEARARFEAGYNEAKSGTGKRYTLAELEKLAKQK